METINKRKKRLAVPRFISIISKRLNMKSQPNRGSSIYLKLSKNKIINGQEDLECPMGTLRLSDHWDYENSRCKNVFRTDITLSKGVWALCINTCEPIKPWKVLEVFKIGKNINIIKNINFQKIQLEIDKLL